MCFSTPKIPDPPKAAPIPNRQNDANQAAVNATLKRARSQDVTAATTLTGGLGDTGYGQNINRVTALGAA